MSWENFECDQCGACCQTLIVEADYLDALREPRLFQINEEVTREGLHSGQQCVVLYDSERNCCPFLRGSMLKPGCHFCSIYQTRPNECVSVEAGDAKCQQARGMKGLGILKDKNGNVPTRAMLEQSCEHYGLEFDEVFTLEVKG